MGVKEVQNCFQGFNTSSLSFSTFLLSPSSSLRWPSSPSLSTPLCMVAMVLVKVELSKKPSSFLKILWIWGSRSANSDSSR